MPNIPQEDNNTIQRCPHDKENPYSMVSRDLIRDETISPECRWLIIYLLSMKDGWKINVEQIKSHVKPFMGKDRLHKIINEAITAGYMMREEWQQVLRRPNGAYQGSLKRVRYFISETPKFKKSLLHPPFPDAEDQGPDKTDDKEITSKKNEHIKESNTLGAATPPAPTPPLASPPPAPPTPPDPPPPPPSIPSNEGSFSSIDQSTLELLSVESQYLSYFRSKIVARWIKKFGSFLVLETIKFFLRIKSTQKKSISNPEAWMEAALKDKYATVNKNSLENKTFAENIKKRYGLRHLKINKRYCQNTCTGKDYYYHLPSQVFQEEILKMVEQE